MLVGGQLALTPRCRGSSRMESSDGNFSFFDAAGDSSAGSADDVAVDARESTAAGSATGSAASAVEQWKNARRDDGRQEPPPRAAQPREPAASEAADIMKAPAPRRREKVPAAASGLVAPAHGLSQMTWAQAKSQAEEETQKWRMRLQGRVPLSELKRHRSETDAWTAVKGRVYNVTGYLHIHPGGKAKLMLGAGKDCTALYNKYHPWVSAEYLLERCFVGFLVPDEG